MTGNILFVLCEQNQFIDLLFKFFIIKFFVVFIIAVQKFSHFFKAQRTVKFIT